MGTLNLRTNAGGSVIFEPQNTATDRTVLVPATSGTMATTSQLTGFRNRMINGDMRIAQRGTSFSGINNTQAYYAADRFRFSASNPNSIWTLSQEVDSPAGSGFVNSTKILCTNGASYTANQEAYFEQLIEGYNIADCDFGTGSAKQMTLSFWVKSSDAGNYGIWMLQSDDIRAAVGTYSILAANTWEFKTIVIPADTVGVLNKTNGNALRVRWYIEGGSALRGTVNANWHNSNLAPRLPSDQPSIGTVTNRYLQYTGVQLEMGSVATPFEFRPFGTEMLLCQRYYETDIPPGFKAGSVIGSVSNTVATNLSTINSTWQYYHVKLVDKRVTPTVTIYGPQGSVERGGRDNGAEYGASTAQPSRIYQKGFGVIAGSGAGFTPEYGVVHFNWTANAEL
jgi:hypothetical protein